MIKNKLDYKLVNFAILCLIIFLIHQTTGVWMGILKNLWTIIAPFFFAFAIAYALYPSIQFLQNKKIPKNISIVIVLLLVALLAALVIVLVVPVLFTQTQELFNLIITFITEFSIDWEIDLGGLSDALNESFSDILKAMSTYLSNGAVSFVNSSLSAITNFFIGLAAAIYFLIDMDKIREHAKVSFKKRSKKTFLYFQTLDHEMKKYLTGFIKISLISVVEYFVVYAIIGHPNALLIGFLALIGGLIPYFGGMIVNVIAAITASVVSTNLLIATIIAFIILAQVDGYIINPNVYGKTNKIHPLVGIIAVFAFGYLLGFTGVVVAMPLAIALITTYRFFDDDIIEKFANK